MPTQSYLILTSKLHLFVFFARMDVEVYTGQTSSHGGMGRGGGVKKIRIEFYKNFILRRAEYDRKLSAVDSDEYYSDDEVSF